MDFSQDFVWGVASAAYQVEGGATAGGRTPTIWDVFSHTPGKTFNGHTGDVATDHYHRYAEDIELMAQLGAKAYRFGIGWTRILPDGRGQVNPEGLAFYDKIVDLCLEKGIEPYITLYHWDLPQVLEDEGGWIERKTAEAFAELAVAVTTHFAGRVRYYFTLNEPQCAVFMGYGNGLHAPGKQLSNQQQFAAICTMARAHGLAAKAMREIDPTIKIGVASTGRLCYPQPATPENTKAAEHATFELRNDDWCFVHTLFLDAVVHGKFSNYSGTFLEEEIANLPEGDLETMYQKPDFIGLNIYNGVAVRVGDDSKAEAIPKYEGYPRTALKWPITPEVMRYGVNFIYKRYGLPIYITENGLSCNDHIFLDGEVHDADRIDFLHRYLRELSLSVSDGTELKGYFHWSFTDNYEWHSGYDDRFGLVYIDYPTQRRIPKDSYYWYKKVIAQNGQQL